MSKLKFSENSISVINFNNDKVPTFKEERNKEWIKFGENNDYPDYLISLFNLSAKHNAIVTGKVHYICGGGLSVDKHSTTAEEEAKMLQLIEAANFNNLLPKITTDIELFGGCYLESIPSRGGSFAQVNHVEFQKIRISKNKDSFWYSNDWTKYRQSYEETGLKKIEKFNPSTKAGLIYYKQYRPGNNIYSLPEYIGAIPYIEIDHEIANFHLNNVKNGFVGGTMLSFNNGVPTAEEQKNIEQRVKRKFTGTDNGGQLIITFSPDKDKAPTVTPLLPNDFDKQFLQLNETVIQEIFTGHKITSLSLFGIKESKGLGSKDEIQQAFSLFQNGYINSKQKAIENIFNDILEFAGFPRCLRIVKTQPIESTIPEEKMYEVMTRDEIRIKAGLPPLGDNGQQMKEQFHSHYSIESFKSVGVPRGNYTIVSSREVENATDVLLKEIAFYKEKFVEYDKIERSILDLINKDGRISIEDISKAINEKVEDVKRTYDNLIERKLLSVSTGELTKLTPEAKTIIEQEPAPTNNVEVLYSYEERKNLPPLLTESRDFCQELIGLDKLYTRAEIELISKSEGRDVWATRGGWFHNTKLNQTTPYCRHIWFQNVVRRR